MEPRQSIPQRWSSKTWLGVLSACGVIQMPDRQGLSHLARSSPCHKLRHCSGGHCRSTKAPQ
jgi:hypothetical protein